MKDKIELAIIVLALIAYLVLFIMFPLQILIYSILLFLLWISKIVTIKIEITNKYILKAKAFLKR